MLKKVSNNSATKQVYWHCDCGKTEVNGPQKIKVIAMRHGESQHNIAKVVNGDPSKVFHLTEKGKEQAQNLANILKDESMIAIVASEMLRTQETAEPLGKIKNLEVQIDKRLNDIGAGELEGMPILEFRKLTHNIKESVKGSETNIMVGRRLKSFLQDLVDCYSGQSVALVSSEIILHSLQQVSMGLPCDEDKGDHVENGVVYEFFIVSPICCPSCGDRCGI